MNLLISDLVLSTLNLNNKAEHSNVFGTFSVSGRLSEFSPSPPSPPALADGGLDAPKSRGFLSKREFHLPSRALALAGKGGGDAEVPDCTSSLVLSEFWLHLIHGVVM